jgi:hypothetical protein
MDDFRAKKRLSAIFLAIVVAGYAYTVTAGLHWMNPLDGWAFVIGGMGIAFGLVSDELISSALLRVSRRFCYFWFILAICIIIFAFCVLVVVGDSKGAASGKEWAIGASLFLGISAFAVAIAAPFGNNNCWQKRRHEEPNNDRDGDVDEPVGDVDAHP